MITKSNRWSCSFQPPQGLHFSNAREWGRIESSLGKEQSSARPQTGGLSRRVTQVPCTWNCKVNSERYLHQHFPQRAVFINPRYAESGYWSPELLAAPGAMHFEHPMHLQQPTSRAREEAETRT
jgi:hypothetical protein